jgi:putative endonuclease
MSLVNSGQSRSDSIGEELSLAYDPKVAVALPAGKLANVWIPAFAGTSGIGDRRPASAGTSGVGDRRPASAGTSGNKGHATPPLVPAQAGIQESIAVSFFVYMLASRRNGTLYVGMTDNIGQRVWQHKSGAIAGFTQKYGVKLLVWFETHETRESAFVRERQIKKWNRNGSSS